MANGQPTGARINMNKLHQSRYNAAIRLFEKFQAKADYLKGTVFYDGEPIEREGKFFTINEYGEIIVGNTTWFSPDPNLDEGLYETRAEYKAKFKESFSIWKKIL